jgi:molybdate transport system regulatory protein
MVFGSSIYLRNYIDMATRLLGLRFTLRSGMAFGPGKAQLLEGIRDTGSIAAAGRRMKMSYSRAWSLVEEMNLAFRRPLVRSAKGGASHGGAVLTALGEDVLKRYRRMEASAARATAADLAALRRSAGT